MQFITVGSCDVRTWVSPEIQQAELPKVDTSRNKHIRRRPETPGAAVLVTCPNYLPYLPTYLRNHQSKHHLFFLLTGFVCTCLGATYPGSFRHDYPSIIARLLPSLLQDVRPSVYHHVKSTNETNVSNSWPGTGVGII